MRYFLIRNGPTVIRKHVYAGNPSAADLLIAREATVGLTFQEVSQSVFDATPVVLPVTADQTAWLAARSAGVAPALAFLARKLGLE